MNNIKRVNISNFNEQQKTNYIKNLLYNNDINDVLSVILEYENKKLEIISIVINSLKDKIILSKVKEHLYEDDNTKAKIFVYSRILSYLSFNKQNIIMGILLNSLDEITLKKLAKYEYRNCTDVSLNNPVFSKYCLRYKKQIMQDLALQKTEVIDLTTKLNVRPEKFNFKKFFLRLFIVIIVVSIVSYSAFIIRDCYSLLNKYENKVIPGVYLKDVSLKGTKLTDLEGIIKDEIDAINKGNIVLSNINGSYTYSLDELGIEAKDYNLYQDIIDYNNNLSVFEKLKYIKNSKKHKVFYIKADYDIDAIDILLELAKNDMNVEAKDDGLIIDKNHNVRYSKGTKGFTLDEENFNTIIEEELKSISSNINIKVDGEVIENKVTNEKLSTVNKKISSYTTSFSNTGNRGHNVSLAASKLNGTILMPGETFSYLKEVGPYNAKSGFKPAPAYLNGELIYANGGGVCQVATTMYMAQLYAGLETVYRTNHSHAPAYVPKGLDATVSSTTVDYKFKNQYKYPIYISAYVTGDYLTVDVWSNDKALDGYTYEPYAKYKNSGYASYLNKIKDGKIVDTKYLGMSYYR